MSLEARTTGPDGRTEIIAEVKVTKLTDWKVRNRKVRVYTDSGPIDAIDYPDATESPCTDGACESYTCKRAHGVWLLRLMGVDFFCTDYERAVPEADHKLFKAAARKGVAAEKPLVIAALAEAGITVTKLFHSVKAGCGCGCSPGWIAEGFNGHEVWVDFRTDEAREAADVEATARRQDYLDAKELTKLTETFTLEEATA